MKLKLINAVLTIALIPLLYSNTTHTMFGPNEGKDVGKEAAKEIADAVKQAASELKNVGKNVGQTAAEELSRAAEKTVEEVVEGIKEVAKDLKNITKNLEGIGKSTGLDATKELINGKITSDSTVRIELDEKTLAGLKSVCIYLKKRGPRIAGGLTLMAGGVVMIVDGVRRIAGTKNGPKIAYKVFEAISGIVMTGGGLYLILR